jgi:hypothetical protein
MKLHLLAISVALTLLINFTSPVQSMLKPGTFVQDNNGQPVRNYSSATSGQFPHIPFEARRIVEMSGFSKKSRGKSLHVFQNSMVIRLQSGHLLACYDDFKQGFTFVVLSFDEGKSWHTMWRHVGVTSMNLFTKVEQGEEMAYGIAHTERGDYVDGEADRILVFRYDFGNFYRKLGKVNETQDNQVRLPELKMERGQISSEYNFLTSNSGVSMRDGKVFKQFDILPQSHHANHRQTVSSVSGTMKQNSGQIRVRLSGAFQEERASKVPREIAARFSVGMRVRLGFGGVEGYITHVEDKTIVVDVDSNEVPLHQTRDIRELYQDAQKSSRILGAVADRNSWWFVLLWADLADDLLDPNKWHMSNIVCGYANHHADLLNTALDMGLPNQQSPYPVQIWPHAEEGFVIPTPDGSLSLFLRFSNRRLCDMALEIPIRPQTIENRAYPYWLGTPRFVHLPTFGRAHPALTYDPVTKGYWIVGNVGRSLSTMAPLTGIAYKDTIRCIWERNAIGLFYSRNLRDWSYMGIIDYRNAEWFQLSYPFILIDGNNMLITLRTTSYYTGYPTDSGYNNHNANAIYMYKIKHFRRSLRV